LLGAGTAGAQMWAYNKQRGQPLTLAGLLCGFGVECALSALVLLG
jgi:hypothetical protein